MTDLLETIRATPWLAEVLTDQFGFDLARTDPMEDVHLPGGGTLTPIAGDDAGGTFMLAAGGAVVYAGAYGEGGLIASTLRESLGLIVGLPSLQDALARPLGDGMRAWLEECDEEIRREWDTRGDGWLPLDEARARVRKALDLPEADGLLAGFHAAMTDGAYRPVSEHGAYRPMR
ncbi:hypothetical protein [Winogradskya humida]|uniref:SUKH-4 immunity protein of toxin-antitoxin system n=1 Tax=Winogradskya humida TaxID=113566 RepID=A0ABQ3ZTU4_9ACTN|nr:hypothetical protein [Actinoplanes humidus]GIE21974.1 hypothetical protein Ahu01nite_050760 [Actinoplanes humidus]